MKGLTLTKIVSQVKSQSRIIIKMYEYQSRIERLTFYSMVDSEVFKEGNRYTRTRKLGMLS